MNFKYLSILLIFSFFLFACNSDKLLKSPNSKLERIAQMVEEEIEMTKDPKTGLMPSHTLYEIRKNIFELQKLKANDSQKDWIQRGPLQVGGRTRALIIDRRDSTGNTIFAGSASGGLWKCTNAFIEPQWEYIETYLGNPSVCALAQDPTNPEVIYLGTGEGWFSGDAYEGDGIYKSIDGGVNWIRLSNTNNPNFRHIQKLLITKEGNILAATRESGIQFSTDKGETWTAVLNNFNQGFSVRAADLEMTLDGTIFAAMGIFSHDGLYRSKDGGIQWEFVDLGIDSFERIEIAVSHSDSSKLVLLAQDENTNACGYVLNSDDGGDTWEERNVPIKSNGSPMADGQAWYDLSLAIDPNDSDVMYAGGVDLFKTTDGGFSWRVVSNWFGGNNLPYVHADQHSITFINGSSDNIYFTNDGGLFLTQNGQSFNPKFKDLGEGYITSQFYTCAIHPDFDRDFFIGGTQDNGTELIKGPGLSKSTPVGGGDGAYCHIDQLTPNIYITSSQNGNYSVRTGNFGQSTAFYAVPGDTYFINPSDYDDVSKILYASMGTGQYYWVNVTTGTQDSILVNGMENDNASAFLVSPFDNNILYIGTNRGRIFKITNPSQMDAESELLFDGPGFTRNIDVDPNNSDRIICTYSNFGIESVYLSENGGLDWRSIEGDLPNIPVRWGIFNPKNSNEVLLATEVGIWLGSVESNETNWENISGSIGLGRVNMLKYRTSDQSMLAASYGKGLFTTEMFAKKGLKFDDDEIRIEIAGDINLDFCNPIDLRNITISSGAPFETDSELTISINNQSTAIEGEDFIITNKQGILPAGETEFNFEVQFLDNAYIDGDKILILEMESNKEIFRDKIRIVLEENDRPFQNGLSGTAINIGNDDISHQTIFNGLYLTSRTQLLFTRELLANNNLIKGRISKMFFEMLEVNGPGIYQNFKLSMGHTNAKFINELDETTPLTVVYDQEIEIFEGLNLLFLENEFQYDGESGLLLEFCYNNEAMTDNDFISSTNVDYASVVSVSSVFDDTCPSIGKVERSSFLPNVTFESFGVASLYNETFSSFQSELTDDYEIYFQKNDSILSSAVLVNNLQQTACVNSHLIRNSNQVIEENNDLWVDRITYFESDVSNNNELEITYFISKENSDIWLVSDLEALFTSDDIDGNSPIEWNSIPLKGIVETENYFAVTVPFSGDGSYTVGLSNSSVGINELPTEQQYDEIRYFDILGQQLNTQDIINNNDSHLKIILKAYFFKGTLLKTIKQIK